MPLPTWSDWKRLSTALRLQPQTLAEILDGGQSFRWRCDPDGFWTGAWDDHVVRLRQADNGRALEWQAPATLAAGTEAALTDYLALDTAVDAAADALPWRTDPHLAQCMDEFPGLRILRQPFGETLLCFLCSATKQIVQIKQMTALLATRLGAEVVPGHHRLPSWPELASVSEKALRECLLGFRARHIHATAQFLDKHPGWLDETERLPYAEAKVRLCELPGVGEKVADCVLLFGARRLEAFPVDVWIIRTMAARYGLTRWRPEQIAHFGRVHFGPCAGLAQQFLFAWERRAARLARG